MRLIDADAFKEYIKGEIDGLILPKDQAVKVIAITKSFLKDIDEQPTVEIPLVEWIPCSERLPEEDGRFLVFLPDRKGTFMCADFLSGKWYPDDYECTSNHVIAWMPLPKPYRKEESE